LKISKITTQKKNKQRYNIFIDYGSHEEYAFSVDEEVLITFELRKGLALTDELLQQIEAEDNIQKAYNKVINYLSYRMRTEQEIRTYLKKEEITEGQIHRIVNRLKDSDLIDDLEFAKMFVRTRMNTSVKGPGLIQKELHAKGISDQNAIMALEQFPPEGQKEKALKIAKKRLNRRSKHSFQKQLDQVRAALIRNGYSADIVSKAIKEVADYRNSDEEWEAIVHHGERFERRFSGKYSDYEARQKIKEGLYRQGFHISLINEYLESRS